MVSTAGKLSMSGYVWSSGLVKESLQAAFRVRWKILADLFCPLMSRVLIFYTTLSSSIHCRAGLYKSDRLLAIEGRGVVRVLAIGIDRGEKRGSKWNEKKGNHLHTPAGEISTEATMPVRTTYIRVRWVVPIWYSNMWRWTSLMDVVCPVSQFKPLYWFFKLSMGKRKVLGKSQLWQQCLWQLLIYV